jgi:hypothetical protein
MGIYEELSAGSVIETPELSSWVSGVRLLFGISNDGGMYLQVLNGIQVSQYVLALWRSGTPSALRSGAQFLTSRAPRVDVNTPLFCVNPESSL